MKMKIASLNDIDGILKLHTKYQIDTIKEADKKDGFVTTSFTKSQLADIIEKEQGIFIALKDDEVVAYVMSASWQYWSKWDMFKFMICELPNIHFKNSKLTIHNSYQYGPICIDKSERGSGLLQALFNFSISHMEKKYEYLVTFINKINHRSHEAHTKKLYLEVIHEFTFNNNNYYELACKTSQRAKS